MVEGGVVYFIRTDHIGRPVFATDSAGTKIWEASYTPFGEVETTTGSPIALRFPGQWFQSESGLHQNWMRDYDPTTGRYIQADPLGLVDEASVYGYALQNPGRYTDPKGEQVFGGNSSSSSGAANENCAPTNICSIHREFDGPGLSSRGWEYPPGKLFTYD
ncbi:MAG: RHS repeat-associated core domain-containing protein, partial [Pseudomonadota bacterium]